VPFGGENRNHILRAVQDVYCASDLLAQIFRARLRRAGFGIGGDGRAWAGPSVGDLGGELGTSIEAEREGPRPLVEGQVGGRTVIRTDDCPSIQGAHGHGTARRLCSLGNRDRPSIVASRRRSDLARKLSEGRKAVSIVELLKPRCSGKI
jgi:hypothetical protein